MDMGCDLLAALPPSSSSSSSPLLLMHLPVPLLELTFSSLPLRSVLSLSSSSKSLLSLLSSPSFLRLHSLSPNNLSPWFFFFGFNLLLPLKSQAFAFDPSSLSWIALPFLPPPSHNFSSLSALNGTLFALAGAKQSRLCISPSPLKQNWQTIDAPMAVERSHPMVGMFFDDPCDVADGCIIVAGGAVDDDDDDDDELAVEMYDVGKRQWKRCESMPEVLKGKSLSSATLGGRFYVGDCDGDTVCWLERGEESWGHGKVERPTGVIWWQWVASEPVGLLAVALCAGGSVKIYKMEEQGSKMKEVAEMPAGLFELFEEEDEKQAVVRSCAGGSNLIYVYSDSQFKDYAACLCELGERGSKWHKLPPLPAPRNRFDRVTCVSAAVSLASCTLNSL